MMPITAPMPPPAMADGVHFRGQAVRAMSREELLGVVGYYMQKHIEMERLIEDVVAPAIKQLYEAGQ